jgi:N,N-dimethylformamidase beta subunit-like protein
VSDEAVSAGQRERIYVSAPRLREVRIEIYRMGWPGGKGGREVLRTGSLAIAPQPGCSHRLATGLTECHWRPTLSFRVPPALPSGVYIAKLTGRGAARDCLFVVLASDPQPLLAHVPTSTYQA